MIALFSILIISILFCVFQWASPSEALTEHCIKGGGLAPPQVYELVRLLNFRKIEDLRINAADKHRQRVERLFPVTAVCQDYALSLMPGE